MPLDRSLSGVRPVPPRSFRRAWLAGLALVGALAWLVASCWPVDPAPIAAPAIVIPEVDGPQEVAPEQAPPETAGAQAEAPPPEMMVELGRVVPRRASEAERADYKRRLDSDTDLVALAAELKRIAESGDADAAATLATLHGYCADALRRPVTPPKPAATTPAPHWQSPPNPAQRCARFGAAGELTALNLKSSANAWRHTAAQLGDLPSQLIGDGSLYSRPGSPQAQQRQRAIEEMLRRGDYGVLQENLHLVTGLAEGRLSSALGSTICMLAGPCETKACRYRCEERLDAEWQQLAPREQRVRLGQQAAVLEAIRSGRYDSLWPRPLAGVPQ